MATAVVVNAARIAKTIVVKFILVKNVEVEVSSLMLRRVFETVEWGSSRIANVACWEEAVAL